MAGLLNAFGQGVGLHLAGAPVLHGVGQAEAEIEARQISRDPWSLEKKFGPPACKLVHASDAIMGVSPLRGTVTERGFFRISCTFLKAEESWGVQTIVSFPDLVAGICRSRGFVTAESCGPGSTAHCSGPLRGSF